MKQSRNPPMTNPIRFEKNVGEAEGPREFYFDPHTGKFGTLYTYEDVGQRGDYENHGSLNGAIPIDENVQSAMLRHYWDATIVERTEIRREAGYEDDDLEIPPSEPADDADVIEQRQQTFDGQEVTKQERERFEHGQQPEQEAGFIPQEQPPNGGMPIIPVHIEEYIQTRDVIRAQEIGLRVLIPMLESKLEPDAPEHNVISVLKTEIERAKGIDIDQEG